MRVTRLVSVIVAAASLGLGVWSGAGAQGLRTGQTPAEFPPASYKGKQYVDSRGCIFIRAGIDGNVTWVPRVTRARKPVCGYKPSLPPGSGTAVASAPKTKKPPEQITLPPASASAEPDRKKQPETLADILGLGSRPGPKPKPEPAPTPASAPAKPKPKPKPKVAPKVRTTAVVPVRRKPAPATNTYARPAAKPAARTTAPVSTVADEGPCPGVSALSRQYINSGKDLPVRCGPQAEPPVTYKDDRGSYLGYPPGGTRIVPRHVYDNRQNTQNVTVPRGYRTVWTDGRLNPHRAERTTAPYAPTQTATVPRGYRLAWTDGRLNGNRGGTAAGNAATRRVWSDTVPRKLVRVPTDRQVVTLAQTQTIGLPRARAPERTRARALAHGSRPAAAPNPQTSARARYIRVAVFATDAEARAAGKALARRTGLTIRLGTLTRNGKNFRAVMAGPYTQAAQAENAMARVRGAGYPRARLSR